MGKRKETSATPLKERDLPILTSRDYAKATKWRTEHKGKYIVFLNGLFVGLYATPIEMQEDLKKSLPVGSRYLYTIVQDDEGPWRFTGDLIR